jgi:xylan alpha-glucuronosyltransferase
MTYRHPRGVGVVAGGGRVLHSSDKYLFGSIVVAQSIRRADSQRDLILHDHTGLEAGSGWTPSKIKRICNPRAARTTTASSGRGSSRSTTVVFVDADIQVLRNLDAALHLRYYFASLFQL